MGGSVSGSTIGPESEVARIDRGARYLPTGDAELWLALPIGKDVEVGGSVGVYLPTRRSDLHGEPPVGLDTFAMTYGSFEARAVFGRRWQYSLGGAVRIHPIRYSWKRTVECQVAGCAVEPIVTGRRNVPDVQLGAMITVGFSLPATDRLDVNFGSALELLPTIDTGGSARCDVPRQCPWTVPTPDVGFTATWWVGFDYRIVDSLRLRFLVLPVTMHTFYGPAQHLTTLKGGLEALL